MKIKLSNKSLLLMGIVTTVVITVLLILIILLRAYWNSLTRPDSHTPSGQTEDVNIRNIEKISIQDRYGPGCIEITPDGVVRVYDVCGDDPEKVFRTTDMNQISRLFKTISGEYLNSTKPPPANTLYYKVVVELDDGDSYTIYIIIGDERTSDDWVKDLIDDVVDDAPEPTITPTIFLTPTPTIFILASPTSTPSVYPTYYPTPTPTPPEPGAPEMFNCEFDEESLEGRPFRISNVVCTSEPE